ncbi:hypothetical protein BGZ93_005953 [Podila epicladia]|nr:hypothetical protein BGZ92_004079 [Podila epicladia]KAG0095384.1 hypothetical protein BGZ93_005953 [Podila epicladia]
MEAPLPGTGEGVAPPPTYYKFIGMALAISSGIFIGTSLVIKKKGLLRSSAIAGEGHAYLRSALWWTGMVMMIIGEILNFVAYSFAPALIVTPLGAFSVVVCAVLSSLILKEKLNMNGKIGCALCIVGAVIIVLHAPAQDAVTDIDEFKHFVLQPGFLVYMSLVIVSSLFIIWRVAPKYGKKHLLVYITVCSLIGSLSVVATQGLGAAIVLNITKGIPQFDHWFIYATMVFVACALIAEMNYLNKALNLFNTAMVTPVYYVFFTSATLVASVILFQGFSASPGAIMTVVMGFFVICAGVVLLQTSKSAAHSEAMKRSKSSMSLQSENGDEHDDFLDDGKEALEPGPLGLRAVPFDSIRQIVRASTMPNTPHSTPGATPVTVHVGNDSVHHTGRSLFGRSRHKSEMGSAPGGSITPGPAIEGVLVTDEHARSSMQAVVIPINEKADYSEEHGAIILPQMEPHQGDKDGLDTPFTSQTLTLHDKE